MNKTYEIEIPADVIPETVRWDVSRHNQGQIVEISYSDLRPNRGEGGVGDDLQRVEDRSDRTVRYYARDRRVAATLGVEVAS